MQPRILPWRWRPIRPLSPLPRCPRRRRRGSSINLLRGRAYTRSRPRRNKNNSKRNSRLLNPHRAKRSRPETSTPDDGRRRNTGRSCWGCRCTGRSGRRSPRGSRRARSCRRGRTHRSTSRSYRRERLVFFSTQFLLVGCLVGCGCFYQSSLNLFLFLYL